MNSASIFRAAAACALLTVAAAAPAHAQLGGLRRAAQRAVSGAAAPSPASPAGQPAAASSRVNTGDVLEMTAPVLDRFQRALAAESADRGQLAQRLAAVKTPEAYGQCNLQWYTSAPGQAVSRKVTEAAERSDQAAIAAAAEEMKAAMERACGPDPAERGRIQNEAQAHAAQAGQAAGEFSPRQYAVIKERAVPFCRAAGQATGEGDVRLPGRGTNVYWVYTPAEAAALRERCGALLRALADNS